LIAGTLMGITNGVATIPGFISPSVVGALTNGNVTISYVCIVLVVPESMYVMLYNLMIFLKFSSSIVKVHAPSDKYVYIGD
jgi:hypothetical protein